MKTLASHHREQFERIVPDTHVTEQGASAGLANNWASAEVRWRSTS